LEAAGLKTRIAGRGLEEAVSSIK
jgi:hypothetical protein